jgi:hypothetical protein
MSGRSRSKKLKETKKQQEQNQALKEQEHSGR